MGKEADRVSGSQAQVRARPRSEQGPSGVQPRPAAENGQTTAFTHWEKLPQSCPHRLGLCCLKQATECVRASVSSYANQMDGYHPAKTQSYRRKWIRLENEAVCARAMWGWDVLLSGSHQARAWMYTVGPLICPLAPGRPGPAPHQETPPTLRCLAIPKGCRLRLQILLGQTSVG